MTISNYKISAKFIFITLFILISSNYAQSSSKSFQEGVIYLSVLIADSDFENDCKDDLEIIDSLYTSALTFYEGDISEALLALTFATLPFNKMPVVIPLLNQKIELNLPSVNTNLFKIKKKKIPGNIYFDTKSNGGEDKDKISHFFGNAFLSYNISIINISRFLGMLVEMFEAAFKVSSKIDFRDILSNHLGEYFGYLLKINGSVMPSDILKVYSLFYFSYNY